MKTKIRKEMRRWDEAAEWIEGGGKRLRVKSLAINRNEINATPTKEKEQLADAGRREMKSWSLLAVAAELRGR